MVGTDLLHAALLLWIAGAGHLIHGNVDLHAIAWLLVGSIPGVLLGSHLSIRVPDRVLRVAFAVVLVLSGIKLVKVPAADTVVEVGAALAVAGLLVWTLQMLRTRRIPVHDAA
jgi:sugar phosphate permease